MLNNENQWLKNNSNDCSHPNPNSKKHMNPPHSSYSTKIEMPYCFKRLIFVGMIKGQI